MKKGSHESAILALMYVKCARFQLAFGGTFAALTSLNPLHGLISTGVPSGTARQISI